jgi:(p)ppGpp synthase/HD superfamily hydrolase
MTTHKPRFDMQRFAEALSYAAHLHAKQTRKGSDLPYISHLLGVASLTMEYGGSEDECIAALLHDAAEDQGGKPTLRVIRAKFGDVVAEIVDGCTDAYAKPGARKPGWKKRKAKYIAHLHSVSKSVRLVSAADKLHNARAILADYREHGDKVYDRFNKSKDETLWYYRRLANTYRELLPGQLSKELHRVVTTLEKSTSPQDAHQMQKRKLVYSDLDKVVDIELAKKALIDPEERPSSGYRNGRTA